MDILAKDLHRQFGKEFEFSRNAKRDDAKAGTIQVPLLAKRKASQAETWIALSSPLAPTVPINAALHLLSTEGKQKLECVDDLVARRHLPEASLRLRRAFR